MNKEKIIGIILFSVCLIWIVVDAILKEELFRWNYAFTKNLQQGQSNPSHPKYVFFQVMSFIGESEIKLIAPLLGYLFFPNKIQSLKYLITLYISSLIMTILKIWYHEPRPYFVYTDLINIGCDQEFAKPSGHTLGSTVFFYLIFDSFINRKFFIVPKQQEAQNEIMILPQLCEEKINSNFPQNSQQIIDEESNTKNINNQNNSLIISHQQSNNDMRKERFLNSFIYLPIYLVIIFLIGFSRIILGAHTFGQVIIAWVYATIYLIFYRWKFESILEKVLNDVTYKNFQKRQELIIYFLKISLVYITLLLIGILSYYFINASISDYERNKYKQNFINNPNCTNSYVARRFLSNGCLSDLSCITFSYSLIIVPLLTQGSYKPELWISSYRPLRFFKKVFNIKFIKQNSLQQLLNYLQYIYLGLKNNFNIITIPNSQLLLWLLLN
ncbi:hypothetical protein ABPG74_004951 [Tetrahymena malaccensis]